MTIRKCLSFQGCELMPSRLRDATPRAFGMDGGRVDAIADPPRETHPQPKSSG